jgi:hypothetical protein
VTSPLGVRDEIGRDIGSLRRLRNDQAINELDDTARKFNASQAERIKKVESLLKAIDDKIAEQVKTGVNPDSSVLRGLREAKADAEQVLGTIKSMPRMRLIRDDVP